MENPKKKTRRLNAPFLKGYEPILPKDQLNRGDLVKLRPDSAPTLGLSADTAYRVLCIKEDRVWLGPSDIHPRDAEHFSPSKAADKKYLDSVRSTARSHLIKLLD
ncbi:hypothetical protein COU20_04070 [Candidatus Kaiserbacteria bacterium CG10_big_fil_rev_8_21_14_0_10_59_10]|uniref:Uncharacterized protein n=1 Tax=Candidatus Kaiserbacteria bacterium CG10_big_fil_rev_8_21_14_0_10_59_10 TaxID=1974612 RepID=A0A2H0U6S5_9BACT|nr:MAG: hypothetical protein COU20_04070 [Candidatus Kaiserbacteria bacterium CG10_big_fil_rev_8_21_14_0_10_59_10]